MKKSFLAGIVLMAAALPAQAVDGVSLELGSGEKVDMFRVGLQWRWDKKWFDQGGTELTGYWDLTLGGWDSHRKSGGNESLAEVGITPVFRLQAKGGKGPYLEGGIGAHLISKTRIANDMDFGTTFQFGEHVGVGIVFGDRGEFDLGYRFQHLSNGGLDDDNTGINFHQARFAYRF